MVKNEQWFIFINCLLLLFSMGVVNSFTYWNLITILAIQQRLMMMLKKIPFACQIERLTVHFGWDENFFENPISLPNLEYPDYNALHKSLFCLFFFYSTCGKTKKVVSWSFEIRNPISKNVTWQHEPYYDSHKQITSLSPFKR